MSKAVTDNATNACIFVSAVVDPYLLSDLEFHSPLPHSGMGRLDVSILMAVFIVSAVLGDAVNYAVGKQSWFDFKIPELLLPPLWGIPTS